MAEKRNLTRLSKSERSFIDEGFLCRDIPIAWSRAFCYHDDCGRELFYDATVETDDNSLTNCFCVRGHRCLMQGKIRKETYAI